MIEFLQTYWQVIASLLLFVAGLLISLFKRNKVVDSAYALTLEQLPLFIASAEKLFGSGEGSKKFSWVLKIALAFYRSLNGTADISEILSCDIEKILATPEKKG